jgi:hypothetical protein
MAKRLAIPSKELELAIVGSRDSFIASRVQNTNIDTDIPTTDIDEIGNPEHAGTVKDIPSISLTFSAFDVGVKIISALTGTDPQNYPAAGVDAADLGEIDAIFYVKDDSVADYVKSMHARKMQIQDFTYSYSVDGESTEDYTAAGSKKRWFKYDVYVDKFTTGTTSFTLSETPLTLSNGDELLSVILDGDYLKEVDSGPSTGEYSVSGTTLTTSDSRSNQCIAIYHANPSGNNWTDVSDGTMPAAIRGRDVKVEIATEDISRVQSVEINGSLNVDEVREMGNREIVGYQKQVPTVEGTLTVLDTDTELIDLLTHGSVGSGETEFEVGVTTPDGLSLDVILYDPNEDAPGTVSGVVLKTVYVPSIEIVGDSYTVNVNDNASQEFRWRSSTGQCLIYSGSR